MANTTRSRIAKLGVLAFLLCLCTGTALADLSFDVQGSTSGQFYVGSTNIPLGTSIGGLTFSGTSFGPTRSNQIVLGTFNLSSLLFYFDPFDFKLSVDFIAPTTGGATFRADVSGLVTMLGGSATVNFVNNGPRQFAFTNAQGSGVFDLYITDVTVARGGTASIIGHISNSAFSATPEPTAIVLTSVLFGGLILIFRKRLSSL